MITSVLIDRSTCACICFVGTHEQHLGCWTDNASTKGYVHPACLRFSISLRIIAVNHRRAREKGFRPAAAVTAPEANSTCKANPPTMAAYEKIVDIPNSSERATIAPVAEPFSPQAERPSLYDSSSGSREPLLGGLPTGKTCGTG